MAVLCASFDGLDMSKTSFCSVGNLDNARLCRCVQQLGPSAILSYQCCRVTGASAGECAS